MAKLRKRKKNTGGELVYDADRMPRIASQLVLAGYTNKEIAETLGVTEKTFYQWRDGGGGRKPYREFREALEEADKIANGRVAEKLMERALGYTHTEEKIFSHPETKYSSAEVVRVRTRKHYPPDTQAALRWLSVRKPDPWAAAEEHAHRGVPGAAPIGLRDETKSEIVASILNLIKPKPDPT